MNTRLISVLLFSAISLATFGLSVWSLPRLIMHRVVDKVAPVSFEVQHASLADADAREVVMPSPDMLYSLCRIDLSNGPARISAAPTNTDYWSIALYGMNSDNFHVLNDRDAAGKPVSLRIVRKGTPAQSAGDLFEQTVVAPGDSVLLLMRTLVRNREPETLARLEEARRTLRCESDASERSGSAATTGHSAATPPSADAVGKVPPGIDATSWDFANRGLIARPSGRVLDDSGKVLWDYDSFDFLQGESPATVNASLWRQAMLNNRSGLYKVRDGIWQLRGFDLSNMTLIEGAKGWIVVDPLTTRQTASAALAFARKHLGDKPVSAVIFTHSHIDHFGGVLGVVTDRDVADGRIPVIAPAGFMEEATSENLMVGLAMGRRSMFMYGGQLPRSATGLVDNGLGKAVPYGSFGIVPPTRIIEKTVESHTIDGVRFVFHNVPGSEAPSEFVFHLPDLKAFGGAELFGHTLHNLYTLRGAKVRDALKWSRYMDDVLVYLRDSDVMFNQHNWPVWGRDAVLEHASLQRDVYRYLHDQTVRMMNQGLTAGEISESLRLPPELDRHLSTRGYYGTVRHNVRAIYQFYLGWYDANPATLNPVPPVVASRRYVEIAGGVDRLLDHVRAAQAKGDHRWAAELGRHAVLAQPDNKQARELLAVSLEKMGYESEASTWRNAYLTGAYELRNGTPRQGLDRRNFLDMLRQTPVERFFESMAASLNPERSAGVDLRINFEFTDTRERFALHVRRSILNHERVEQLPPADATLRLTKAFFMDMLVGEAGAGALLTSSQTKIDGSVVKLGQFFRLLDRPDGLFPIMTRPAIEMQP